MNYADIPGYFGYELFYDMLIEIAPPSFFMAEVGVLFGRSTVYMLNKANAVGKEAFITVIDTWSDYSYEPELKALTDGHDVRAEFLNNIAGYRDYIDALKMASVEAAEFLRLRYDFSFIDARHDYESVKADIQAWLPWTDLIIAGHDYGTWEGVTKAVDELLPDHKVMGNVWYQRVGHVRKRRRYT